MHIDTARFASDCPRHSARRARAFAVACTLVIAAAGARAAPAPIPVNDKTFACITQLTPVRGFYVGNLLGKLGDTLKVARSASGGVYPPGSVVQLVPTEVMVKQPAGFNPATRDWEFFELDVSKDGSKIRKRGFVEVVNRFGGNCFACHVKARPEWDFVCETGHGCDPIPLTDQMIGALQRTDPRCPGAERVSAADAQALKDLAALQAKKPAPPAAAR
ncbi:MAG: hypothetical protein JSR54_06365 [Proteobacteria bacterium]|nr:hypothetical protein [Pseudomonadota bacterium]